MPYIAKPHWEAGAWNNAWDSMTQEQGWNAAEHFREKFNIELSCDESYRFTKAEFDSEDAYVLFMLEWS